MLGSQGNSTSGESGVTAVTNARPQVRLPISYRDVAAFVASVDFLIIVAAAILSEAAYRSTISPMEGELSRILATGVFVAVLFVSASNLRKLYEPSRLANWNEQLQNIAGTWCGTFLLLSSGVFASGVSRELSRGTTLIFWAAGGAALVAHRAFWRVYLPAALSNGALKGRNAVVISWDVPLTRTFSTLLAKHGYRVIGEFTVNSNDIALNETLGDAITFVQGEQVDDIFLIPHKRQAMDMGAVASALRILPVPLSLVPDSTTAELIRNPWYELGSFLAVEVQRPPLSPTEQKLKRTFDLLVAASALALLVPVFVAVAIAIRFDSPGPILFRQTRHSFNGIPFKIFKFRTMYVLEDGEHIPQATQGDSRVTRIGAWLRRTSIDELPQLLNVLRGEMSIVGPRPHAASHDRVFAQCIENYAYRHHVKSGITGWAQVNGARGETNTLEKIQKRVDLDLWYIKHWSLRLDISIIVRTVGAVLRGKNAF